MDDLLDVQGDESKLGKRVGKDSELGKVAPVERQLGHLLALDGLADRRVGRVGQGCGSCDLHGRAQRARRQLEDQGLRGCHFYGEIHRLALKALRLDLGLIRAARHSEDLKFARVV